MLAVTLAEAELRPLLTARALDRLINGPRLCVVAGPVDAVAAFEQRLGGERDHLPPRPERARVPLEDARADPAGVRSGSAQAQPRRTAHPVHLRDQRHVDQAAQATDPAYWALHATHTARFSDALRTLWQLKDAVLLEVGPGRTLGVLAMQHPDEARVAIRLRLVDPARVRERAG